jgi:hypothetical protein
MIDAGERAKGHEGALPQLDFPRRIVMVETKTIDVNFKQWGALRLALHNAIVWGYLVGAEGVSHVWFGGSWVVDAMIIVALISILITTTAKKTGASVRLTPAEIRLWVAAGMPGDIKAWQRRSLSGC